VPEPYILAMQGKRVSVYSETRPEVLFEAYKNVYHELSLAVSNGTSRAVDEQVKRTDRNLKRMENLLMTLVTTGALGNNTSQVKQLIDAFKSEYEEMGMTSE